MTDALRALFELLETEEEDFAKLVEQFGIDPAVDFQNCDLTDVDFGSFTAETLNLTGSKLNGANLSKVTCGNIIGIDEQVQTPTRLDPLDDVLIAIARYQNADWSIDQIIREASDGHPSPVLAFYDTTAEQDLLTKRVCTHYGDASHVREGFNSHATGMKLLWFYAKAVKGQVKLNPASLDKSFFEALRASNVSDDIGLYPFRANHSAIERIRKSVRAGTYDLMRADFVSALRRELEMRVLSATDSSESMVVFSGFPPISKRLYKEMREAVLGRLHLIFLCSSSWEPEYSRGEGLHWRRVAIPRYSIGEPLTSEADVRRLIKRIDVASGGRIHMTMEEGMEGFVGKPLSILKEHLADEIRVALKDG